jgi:Family of unknown function (DUF6174)
MVGVATVSYDRVVGWRTDPDAPTARPADPKLDQVPTIDDLLTTAVRAETEATGPVKLVFDPVTGVPNQAFIDWMKDVNDEEGSWKVSDFRRFDETPTVVSDRSMFCDLAMRATKGSVAFDRPGEADALIAYEGLTEVQRNVLSSALAAAAARVKAGNGWDNSSLVGLVNEVCGVQMTPVTMTP